MGAEVEDPAVASESYAELRDGYNKSLDELDKLGDDLDKRKANTESTPEDIADATAAFNAKYVEVEQARESLESKEARDRARAQFKKIPAAAPVVVKEKDIYHENSGRSFFADMFNAKENDDYEARERIDRHQRYEIEKRATTSTTLGGIIPPAYLVDLYAKASRNGRVFADQCNGAPLPDVGMSLIVPRITTATAAGVQATENTTVTTQDPAETDLTVPVRTLAGYLPVSRQGIERAAYSDQILFEDLIARYWALLDTQAINGSGSSGQMLGVLNTSSIASSTASTATVAGVWPKISDVIQQINTNTGGLGYVATKVFMHPRRWGFFEAALDSQNRPLMPTEASLVNIIAIGDEPGYGKVGRMHGADVYIDANIPTNLGAGTNQDAIIVIADPIVHLWERAGDPVTLSFEQQAGTSLQVQLIVYGYAAFTAGRYPGASGAVTGAGLVPPTF